MNASSIQIKPRLDAEADCHGCGTRIHAGSVLWQGIHVCARFECSACGTAFIEDLSVGHAISAQVRVDLATGAMTGHDRSRDWFGEPLRSSLQQPDNSPIGFEVEIRKAATRVVVLNCIDFLYGHSLLKLLNATHHLRNRGPDLVVLVPSFLRWLVPEGVAEVWTVDLPLARAQRYFPDLQRRMDKEFERFEQVEVSRAFSHPSDFRLEDFTRVPRHDFSAKDYRVTFVWRADRLWLPENLWTRIARRVRLHSLMLVMQRLKIRILLGRVRRVIPRARLTVAGLGRQGNFPSWIEDSRVDRLGDTQAERAHCRIYSESRVVIGVHGSNLLLPSGHAGMCIDLMPAARWSNLAQDILLSPEDFSGDQRVSAYRYRFVPISMSPREVADMMVSMIRSFDWVAGRFVSERHEVSN